MKRNSSARLIMSLALLSLPLQLSTSKEEPFFSSNESFIEVWNFIESTFPASSSQAEDWLKVKEAYSETIDSINNQQAFSHRMNQMFSDLGISHMKLIRDSKKLIRDSKLLRDQKAKNTPKTGHIGFDLHWHQNKWYATNLVFDRASNSKLKPGFEIIQIDGCPLPSNSEYYTYETLMGVKKSLQGEIGESRKITFLTDEGVENEIELPFQKWNYIQSKSFGHFPSILVSLETPVVSDVQVIRFSNFVIDIHQQILKTVKEAKNHKGLIFDLRGNTGGVGIMANGIAGRLSNEEFNMGTMNLKEGEINFYVYPQPNPYEGKVAVLVDHFSASTSEIFALGLQESGRAKVFGTQTMGAALPSKFVRLKNGMLFQQAIATLTSANGEKIEGRGVKPDFIVTNSKDDLIQRHDAVLSSALDWILNDQTDK